MMRKIPVSVPGALVDKMDAQAKEEGRTRSDIIREALRDYYAQRRRDGYRDDIESDDELCNERRRNDGQICDNSGAHED